MKTTAKTATDVIFNALDQDADDELSGAELTSDIGESLPASYETMNRADFAKALAERPREQVAALATHVAAMNGESMALRASSAPGKRAEHVGAGVGWSLAGVVSAALWPVFGLVAAGLAAARVPTAGYVALAPYHMFTTAGAHFEQAFAVDRSGAPLAEAKRVVIHALR